VELAVNTKLHINITMSISKRKQLIDSQILQFVRQAEAQELEKEMRSEGIEALRIAARQMAYKKKYYDSQSDKIIVFPSVRHCLLGWYVS
jgi:hypothetical protein